MELKGYNYSLIVYYNYSDLSTLFSYRINTNIGGRFVAITFYFFRLERKKGNSTIRIKKQSINQNESKEYEEEESKNTNYNNKKPID